jgi:hypothetical protein
LNKKKEQLGPGFDLKATNLRLGTETLDYATSKQSAHDWKQPDLKQLGNTKEMVQNLRCKKSP